MFRIIASLALVAALTGCGLIDSDVGDFSLTLPEHEFTVDSDQFGLEAMGMFPSVDCPQFDCAAMSQMFCADPMTCAASCVDMKCEVSSKISLWSMVDMAAERPELATIDQQNGIHVTLDSIDFTITTNTFEPDIAMPQLTIYAAPITVIDWTAQDAITIGTIASINGGYTGSGMLMFVPNGKNTLENFISHYDTPFNLIVGGTMVVKHDQKVPVGMLVGKIGGRAHAGAL